MNETASVKSEYHKKYQTENRDKINERQRQRYNAKKQKQDEENNKIDKLLKLIDGLNNKLEQTQAELRELTINKKQLTDIQNTLTRLLADKIIKEADEEQPDPIKRYIKSIKQTSTTTSYESEDESEHSDSEFEIDENGNVI